MSNMTVPGMTTGLPIGSSRLDLTDDQFMVDEYSQTGAYEPAPEIQTLADLQRRNREYWEQSVTGLPPDRSKFGPPPAPERPMLLTMNPTGQLTLADVNRMNKKRYQSGTPWPDAVN